MLEDARGGPRPFDIASHRNRNADELGVCRLDLVGFILLPTPDSLIPSPFSISPSLHMFTVYCNGGVGR